jgi:thiamine biosynthesis protein ThiS
MTTSSNNASSAAKAPSSAAGFVTANGQQVAADVPCSIETFLQAQQFLPRSVVVEHNGEAVAPSEFAQRQLRSGDRLEIVRIVAGG